MSRQARIIAAYASVKVLDPATGKPTVYGFYRDMLTPPNADPADVARLVRREYAEWVDIDPPAASPPAVEASVPAKPAKTPADKAEAKAEADAAKAPAKTA